MYQSTRWQSADLELLPDNGNRYEIIDGELLVTRAPHWKHQKVITKLPAFIMESQRFIHSPINGRVLSRVKKNSSINCIS